LSRIASLDVGREVKGGGGKTGFDVIAEGGGEACVERFRDWEEVQPVVAGEVCDCGYGLVLLVRRKRGLCW
jgi:hypothetical protein